MISVSKNAYIDKLDEIVNKFSNTYHSTITMKPINELTLIAKIIRNMPNLKIVIMIKNQNIKTVLQTAMSQIGLKKFSWLEIVLGDLKGEEINGTFYKKELQNRDQNKFRAEKVIKREREW